jgi:hypothetical protein
MYTACVHTMFVVVRTPTSWDIIIYAAYELYGGVFHPTTHRQTSSGAEPPQKLAIGELRSHMSLTCWRLVNCGLVICYH